MNSRSIAVWFVTDFAAIRKITVWLRYLDICKIKSSKQTLKHAYYFMLRRTLKPHFL